MEYKRIGNIIVVRMDIGEEILSQIKNVAIKENIKLAKIEALGGTNNFEVGVFDPVVKKFNSRMYQGAYEITSLTGSINTMNGEYYNHMHMAASDIDGNTVGGHLTKAIACPTCEMFITVIDGTVDREYNTEIGINTLKFD